MTLTELPSTTRGTRATTARVARPRPLALLLRYAVLGAVALSILPASAISFPAAAQDKSSSNGNAKSKPAAEQPGPEDGAGVELSLPASINIGPFRDFLARAAKLSAAGEIDLSGTHELRLESDIREGGELGDPLIWLGRSSSPALVDLSVVFVDALKESRVSAAAEGARHIRLVLALDPANVVLTATADMDSERHAQSAANGFGAALQMMLFKTQGRPAHAVWNNMTYSASGKQLALKLEMTRADAGNLLLSRIAPN